MLEHSQKRRRGLCLLPRTWRCTLRWSTLKSSALHYVSALDFSVLHQCTWVRGSRHSHRDSTGEGGIKAGQEISEGEEVVSHVVSFARHTGFTSNGIGQTRDQTRRQALVPRPQFLHSSTQNVFIEINKLWSLFEAWFIMCSHTFYIMSIGWGACPHRWILSVMDQFFNFHLSPTPGPPSTSPAPPPACPPRPPRRSRPTAATASSCASPWRSRPGSWKRRSCGGGRRRRSCSASSGCRSWTIESGVAQRGRKGVGQWQVGGSGARTHGRKRRFRQL